jgi:hypothetical protein
MIFTPIAAYGTGYGELVSGDGQCCGVRRGAIIADLGIGGAEGSDERRLPVPHPPDDDGRGAETRQQSSFRLALYGLTVGLVAFACGRLASAAAGDSGTTTRTTLLIVVPLGVSLLAAYLSGLVLRRRRVLRDRGGQRPS